MKNWFAVTEKSVALREIRKTDAPRYTKILDVLSENVKYKGTKKDLLDVVETVEYVDNFADDGPTAEDAVNLSELKTALTAALETLKPREERVLRKRFGIGLDTDYTLEKIGKEFHCTKDNIRMIEARALRKLKHPSIAGNLRKFLPDAA